MLSSLQHSMLKNMNLNVRVLSTYVTSKTGMLVQAKFT